MRKFASLIVSGIALTGFSNGASAQENYPTQPVTIIVPFSAGGPSDTVARLVAQGMSEELGQQVLVQNVGGAGGTLGAGQVANAAPDGYTLLVHHIGMSVAPTLYRNLAFDPLTDFSPIALLTDAPMTIIARQDFEPETAQDLIAYIKAEGDDLTYAHGGIGGAAHLCGMLLQEATGVQMITVPYQGTAPAMTDIMGGQVDLMCDQATNTTSQIQNNDVKAYAVTSTERMESFPDLPTVEEAGLPALEIGVWHGLYGPAGLDPTIVEKLQSAVQSALADQTVIDRFAGIGTTPVPMDQATPQALTEKLSSQIELWRPIIEAAGVYAD